MSTHLVGQRVKRLEDPDLLSGRGQFVDDLHLPNMVHAAFLRSPFAHARITAIDVSKAASMPGVPSAPRRSACRARRRERARGKRRRKGV